MVPPPHNAEFLACGEGILEVYQRPSDPDRPLVCLDAQPTPLIAETRTPIPGEPGQPQRYDSEYERNNFRATEPLAGWRKVNVRATKTALDLAQEIKELLAVDYPSAEKAVFLWDNRNAHTPASLYKAFPLRRHVGSWIAWKSITRSGMAVGSTWPRLRCVSSPSNVVPEGLPISKPYVAKPRRWLNAATLRKPASTGTSQRSMPASS